MVNCTGILGMLTGAILFNSVQINIKYLMAIAMLIQVVCVPLSLLASDFKVGNIVYTLAFSFGSGLDVMLCLQCLWEHYSDKRGLIAGYIFFVFWLGNLVFYELAVYLLNSAD